jgi:hypothetical protein
MPEETNLANRKRTPQAFLAGLPPAPQAFLSDSSLSGPLSKLATVVLAYLGFNEFIETADIRQLSIGLDPSAGIASSKSL